MNVFRKQILMDENFRFREGKREFNGTGKYLILFRFMEEVSRFRSRCRKYLFALKTKDTEGEEDLSNDRKIVGVHVRWAEKKEKKEKKESRSCLVGIPNTHFRFVWPPSNQTSTSERTFQTTPLKPFSTCLQHPYDSSLTMYTLDRVNDKQRRGVFFLLFPLVNLLASSYYTRIDRDNIVRFEILIFILSWNKNI